MNNNLFVNLRKFLAPEIVYGQGSLRLAGRHVKNFGGSKVLLVTDSGVQENGWTEKVERSLSDHGVEYSTFYGVSPNPRDYEVKAGAEIFLKNDCDLIVAVGGGSPMDCAKGIGILVTNGGDINDYEGVDEVSLPVPPLIFIPTTAGSSADVSQFAIITNTKRKGKIAIISKMVIPDIALVDPTTTLSMSPELTAETGMDALCHAFEAYVSNVSSPLTDMAAITAVQLIAENLLNAYREPLNEEYRDNMMMASLMAGLAFSNASLGIVHAMAHSLGGKMDLPHGECNAILLEKAVFFNYQSCPDKYDQLAEAMGHSLVKSGEMRDKRTIANCIKNLREELNIKQKLSDMGIAYDDLSSLANFAFNDPCLATNPRDTTVDDIEKIFQEIY